MRVESLGIMNSNHGTKRHRNETYAMEFIPQRLIVLCLITEQDIYSIYSHFLFLILNLTSLPESLVLFPTVRKGLFSNGGGMVA